MKSKVDGPSTILTAPVVLFLATLTVIDVPAGTTCAKVNVTVLFVALIVVEFAVFAAVPAANIAPVELFGLTPPTVAIAFPAVGTEGAVI